MGLGLFFDVTPLLSGLLRCEQPPKHAPTTSTELPQPGPSVVMKENHKSKYPFSDSGGKVLREEGEARRSAKSLSPDAGTM